MRVERAGFMGANSIKGTPVPSTTKVPRPWEHMGEAIQIEAPTKKN